MRDTIIALTQATASIHTDIDGLSDVAAANVDRAQQANAASAVLTDMADRLHEQVAHLARPEVWWTSIVPAARM